MDELADCAGKDPLAYRLALLDDPQARAVLEKTAEMADWAERGLAERVRALGSPLRVIKTWLLTPPLPSP